MTFGRSAGYSTAALARLERRLVIDADRPVSVVVLPLDQRTATSPIAAILAQMLQAMTNTPVAAVDVDGVAQPLRRLLGSTGGGDLVGLAASHSASLRRRSVEDYLDMQASVPLAACWLEGPGALPPETLRDAVWKLKRRFPTVVMDAPHGVPVPTIAMACSMASHIVLVGDHADIDHGWLHAGRSVAGELAAKGAVTVVAVGGDDSTRTRCAHRDIVPVETIYGPMWGQTAIADQTATFRIGEIVARIFAPTSSAGARMQ